MNEILSKLLQYLRHEETPDSLQQIEAVLGRDRLMFVLVKMTSKMVFFENCLPFKLRKDWDWCDDLRQFMLLCPDVNQLLTLQDDSLDYHPSISEEVKKEIATRIVNDRILPLSPPSYIMKDVDFRDDQT